MVSNSRGKTIFLSILFVLLSCCFKVVIIQYGLPYPVHVDELTILKDPFKWINEYSSGDYSRTTNLFNWMFLAYSAVVFVSGNALGIWEGVDEFKTFLLSESGNLIFIGRLLSLFVSVLGGLVILRLSFKITQLLWQRVAFLLLILFNPVEWNSTNWIKFEAYCYLAYGLILTIAYEYFVLKKKEKRGLLYLAAVLAVSLRIENSAYLIGFLFYDIFYFQRQLVFVEKIKLFFPIVLMAVVVYCMVTLLPVSIWYRAVHETQTVDLSASPTFEEAIITKLPDIGSVWEVVASSDVYLVVLLALMGPLVLLAFALNLKFKEAHFIYWPFAITAFVLLLFPIKNTHYLLNVSVLILIGAMIYFSKTKLYRWNKAIVSICLLWAISFCINFLILIVKGDVRNVAKEYMLNKTQKNDTILIEGIFSNIRDTPDRYRLRSEAAKQIGSTGLSSSFLAENIDPKESRVVIQVSDYEPFKGTSYEGIFSIGYDSIATKTARAKYLVYVPGTFGHSDISLNGRPIQYSDYFNFLKRKTELEASFPVSAFDPRLAYSNFYYFHSVFIFKLSLNN
jgi:hypothetical protein